MKTVRFKLNRPKDKWNIHGFTETYGKDWFKKIYVGEIRNDSRIWIKFGQGEATVPTDRITIISKRRCYAE